MYNYRLLKNILILSPIENQSGHSFIILLEPNNLSRNLI